MVGIMIGRLRQIGHRSHFALESRGFKLILVVGDKKSEGPYLFHFDCLTVEFEVTLTFQPARDPGPGFQLMFISSALSITDRARVPRR